MISNTTWFDNSVISSTRLEPFDFFEGLFGLELSETLAEHERTASLPKKQDLLNAINALLFWYMWYTLVAKAVNFKHD